MGVVVITRSWGTLSQLWLYRQTAALGSHVDAVIALRQPESAWDIDAPILDWPKASGSRMSLRHRRARRHDERIRKLVQSPETSAILVHFLGPALQLQYLWREIDTPVFVHCHGLDITWEQQLQHKHFGQRRHGAGYVDSVRALASRAVLIANSEHSADQIRSIGIPEERIRVKHYGLEVRDFAPPCSNRTSDVTVLYLGRLVDFKGPDLTIDAFSRACEMGLDGRLIIAGEGRLRTTCELARSRSPVADRISIIGSVDPETGQRLRSEADIFTAHSCLGPLSHQTEAFGVAFAEAMADGLPVATGASGSLPELIDNGVHGILFEPGDVDAHARALLQLAKDPVLRRKLGEAGWARARERFTIEQEREALLRILGS
jgi:glycosyltransferase involved in cell wall biosynthesis